MGILSLSTFGDFEIYLGVEFSLCAVLADDESLRFVDCTTGIGKLSDFNFVRVTLFRSDVDTEGRIGDVLVVEFDTDAVLAWKRHQTKISLQTIYWTKVKKGAKNNHRLHLANPVGECTTREWYAGERLT